MDRPVHFPILKDKFDIISPAYEVIIVIIFIFMGLWYIVTVTSCQCLPNPQNSLN